MRKDINAFRSSSAMSGNAFAHWGLNKVAYIKQTELNGVPVYAVHAANGKPLAAAPARDVAAALVIQNELTPVDTH